MLVGALAGAYFGPLFFAPPVPVVSPDDILLDTEMIFDDRKLALDVYGEEENAAVGNEAIAAGLAAPATAPRAIRFVEPEYLSLIHI